MGVTRPYWAIMECGRGGGDDGRPFNRLVWIFLSVCWNPIHNDLPIADPRHQNC